jgi:N-methylhydantoinase A
MGLLDAAHGVYTVATANMIRAVKAVSTYRGRDPRDFALLAFGGNGPVFAAAMARALGMRRVLVPPAAGLFSAFGLLEADLERHAVQTYFSPVEDVDVEMLNDAYAELEARVRGELDGAGHRDGTTPPLIVERYADLRYSGQNYELTIQAPSGRLSSEHIAALARRFGEDHRRTYGHSADDEPVELVNLRVVARVERRTLGRTVDASGPRQQAAMSTAASRSAYFGAGSGLITTPVVRRTDLAAALRPGPFIVDEYDMTVVVPPDCAAGLDGEGNIVIEVPTA